MKLFCLLLLLWKMFLFKCLVVHGERELFDQAHWADDDTGWPDDGWGDDSMDEDFEWMVSMDCDDSAPSDVPDPAAAKGPTHGQ